MTEFSRRSARRATLGDRWVSLNSRPLEISALYLLTRLARVVRVPGIGVVVSDAGIMRNILLDGENFSKTAPGGTSDLWDPVLQGPGLLNMSGDDHMELKRKLTPLFSTAYLEKTIAGAISGETSRIKSQLLAGKSVDVVKSIEVTAARVICTLAGFDLERMDEAQILEQLAHARGLLRFVKLNTKRLSPEQVRMARDELAPMHSNISLVYDSDRAGTIPHTLKGFGLSKADTTAVITALIIAGTETVISHLPRFTALLLRSGYLSRLSSESDIAAVVQEGLRVTVPTPVMLRGLKRPTRIGKIKVAPGDRILLTTIFACQRLGAFNPDRPLPKEYRHLWFGAGVHMCIGLPMATLEIEQYLRMFIEVNQQSPLTIKEKTVRRGTLTAGFSKLVIACQPS